MQTKYILMFEILKVYLSLNNALVDLNDCVLELELKLQDLHGYLGFWEAPFKTISKHCYFLAIYMIILEICIIN